MDNMARGLLGFFSWKCTFFGLLIATNFCCIFGNWTNNTSGNDTSVWAPSNNSTGGPYFGCLLPNATCLVGYCSVTTTTANCQCSYKFYGPRCSDYIIEDAINSQDLHIFPRDDTIIFNGLPSYSQDPLDYPNNLQDQWMDAIQFNGINQSIDLNNLEDNFFGNAAALGNGGFTSSFLLKLEAPTGGKECIISTNSISMGDGFEILRSGYTLRIFIKSSNLSTTPLEVDVSPTAWIHLVVILRLQPLDFMVYVNGHLVDSQFPTFSEVRPSFGNITWTSQIGSCSTESGFASMLLSEFRFWEGALDFPELLEYFYAEVWQVPDEVFTFDGPGVKPGDNLNKIIYKDTNLVSHKAIEYSTGIKDKAAVTSSYSQSLNVTNSTNPCMDNFFLCFDGITIALWLKISDISTKQSIMTGGGLSIGIKDKTLNVSVYVKESSGEYSSHTVQYTESKCCKWKHYAITFKKGPGDLVNLTLQVNGQHVGSVLKQKNVNVDPVIFTRSFGHPHGLYQKSAKMTIDDLLIWYRQKELDEMKELYESYIDQSTNCLVHTDKCLMGKCLLIDVYYKCECLYQFHGKKCDMFHAGSLDSQDFLISANEKEVRYEGLSTYKSPPTSQSTLSTNKWWTSINLNGLNQALKLPNHNSNFFADTNVMNKYGVTLSLVLKIEEATGQDECIMSSNSNSKGSGLDIVRFGDSLKIYFKEGGLMTKPIVINTTEEWMHLVVIVEPKPFQLIIYVNGDFAESQNVGFSQPMMNIVEDSTWTSYIGACNGSDGFAHMQLVEFRFWEAAIDFPDFIEDLYRKVIREPDETHPFTAEEDLSNYWPEYTGTATNCTTDLSLCTSGLTLAFWIKFDSVEGDQGILTGGGLSIGRKNKSLSVTTYLDPYNDTYTVYTVSYGPLLVDEWYHIGVLFHEDDSEILALLVNAVSKDQTKSGSVEHVPYLIPFNRTVGQPNSIFQDAGKMTLNDLLIWYHLKNRDFFSDLLKMYKDEKTFTWMPTEAPFVSCIDIKHVLTGHDSEKTPKKVAKSGTMKVKASISQKCDFPTVSVTWTISNSTWETNNTEQVNLKKETFEVTTKFYSGTSTPGLYQILVSLQYDGIQGPAPNDSLYVQVEATDIQAIINGGSLRTIQRANMLPIDASTDSFDPDLGNKKDKTGMTFSWICSKLNADRSVKVGSTDCLQGVSTGDKPGMLNINTLDIPAGSYLFNVTIRKDTRTATASQHITLVDNYVPNMKVTCLVNCANMVVPRRKLSLTAECTDCDDRTVDSLIYKWTLHERVGDTFLQHPSLKRLVALRRPQVYADGSLGGAGLVFKRKLLKEGTEYCIKLEVTCNICDKSEGEYCFTTNTPPGNGSCRIIPEEGTALNTPFMISCEDWMDEGMTDPLLTYKYLQETSDGKRKILYRGVESNSTELLLSAGPASANYTYNIIAKVYDALRSFADVIITVKVNPPVFASVGGSSSNESLVENLSNLTTGADSPIEQLLASGDDSQAAQLIGTVADVINDLSDNGVTDSLTEIRGTLIKQVSKMAARVSSTDDVRAMSSALTSTTSVIDQVSETALSDASDAITKLVSASEVLLADAPEEVVNVATSLFGALGNILQASQPKTKVVREVVTLKTAEELEKEKEEQERDTMSPEERAFLNNMEAGRKQRLRKAEEAKTARSAPGLIASEEKVANAVLKTLAPGEEADDFTTSTATIQAQRSEAKDFENKTLSVGGVGIDFKGQGNGTSRKILDIKSSTYTYNPKPWNKNADDLTSPIFKLSVSDENGNGVTPSESLSLKFKNTPPQPIFVNNTVEGNDTNKVTSHKLLISSAESSLVARLLMEGAHDGAVITIRKSAVPTSTTYDVRTEVNGVIVDGNTQIQVVLSAQDLSGAGTYYLIMQPKSNSRKKRSVSSEDGSNVTSTSYSIALATAACRSLDEATGEWSSAGCTVSTGSTVDETECLCEGDSKEKSFAVSVIAPPNLIDFSTVWSKFADLSNNAAVFSTVISILLLYLLLVIWARIQDKRDLLWHEMRELADNSSSDSYSYIIRVDTGYKVGAGTKAHIRFILSGSEQDTGVRNLMDEEQTTFPSGKTRLFLMTTKGSLGNLTTLRIWHNSPQSSWYISKITVEDVDQNKTYIFLCGNWLALHKSDGQIDRTLFAAPKAEVSRFSYIFGETTKQKLSEHHIWVSVFYRPVRNNFTRVQRLSCFVSFLFLTMITSCMFYKSEDSVETPALLRIGPFTFSFQELFVSAISIIIVFPVNLIVIQIFRKAREDPVILGGMLAGRKGHQRFSNETSSQRSTQISHVKSDKSGAGYNNEKTSGDVDLVDVSSFVSYASLVSESNSSGPSTARDPQVKMWPAWLRIVAWILLALAISVSAFFVILYSMDWGAEKSNQWLTSFILSFLEQMFILDPAKVLVITLVLTLILRKTSIENLADPDLKDAAQLAKTDLSEEELFEMRRKEAMTRKESRCLIRDITAVCILAGLVFSLSYVSRDFHSYHLHDTLHGAFIGGSSGFDVDVSDRASFFTWLKDVFVPNYFVERDINGNLYHWRQRKFLMDRASYRVGPARMRQIRAVPVNCTVKKQDWGKCRTETEDKNTFGLGLVTQAVDETRYTSSAWSYQTPDGLWHYGLHGDYPPGGFVIEFDLNRDISTKMIQELENNLWLDRWTRAVIIEFTIYNNNLNLFGRVLHAMEIPESGGILSKSQINIFRIYGTGIGSIYILEGLFAALYIYNIVIFTLGLAKAKCRPSIDFSFFVDAFILGVTTYQITLFALRHIELTNTMVVYKANPKAYVEFGRLANYDSLYQTGWGFLTCFVTLKLCLLLKLNKRLARLGLSLKTMVKPLFYNLLQSSIVYLGLVSLITLWYMTEVEELHSFSKTTATLLSFSLGAFNEVDQMMDADPIFTPVFFAVLMILMNLVIINCFIAIIMETHQDLEDTEMLSAHDYKLILFVKKDINTFIRKKLGFTAKQKK